MTQEELDIEFIKLVIGDNVKQLNKLHYERMKEKKVKCEMAVDMAERLEKRLKGGEQ